MDDVGLRLCLVGLGPTIEPVGLLQDLERRQTAFIQPSYLFICFICSMPCVHALISRGICRNNTEGILTLARVPARHLKTLHLQSEQRLPS